MSEQTGIAWTDSTVNFWSGCTKVSPGCANCYAEAMMDQRLELKQAQEELDANSSTLRATTIQLERAEAQLTTCHKLLRAAADRLSELDDAHSAELLDHVDAFDARRKALGE